MPTGLMVFLVMTALALGAWFLFRSGWYREAMGDLEGMRNAPENKMGPSGLQNANPFYQIATDDDRKKPKY